MTTARPNPFTRPQRIYAYDYRQKQSASKHDSPDGGIPEWSHPFGHFTQKKRQQRTYLQEIGMRTEQREQQEAHESEVQPSKGGASARDLQKTQRQRPKQYSQETRLGQNLEIETIGIVPPSTDVDAILECGPGNPGGKVSGTYTDPGLL
jgi:hypothetical protein